MSSYGELKLGFDLLRHLRRHSQEESPAPESGLIPWFHTASRGRQEFQYESNRGMKDVNHQVDHRRHDHFVRVTSST